MAVFVTCGHQDIWCEFAQSQMRAWNIVPPAPGQVTGLNMDEVLSRIVGAEQNGKSSSTTAYMRPIGKAWDFATSDIVMTNSVQKHWGWANAHNVFILDYLAQFEPHAQFVLVYGSLEESLAFELQSKGEFPADLTEFFNRWQSYHERVLEFFFANSDRCVLTHVSGFERSLPLMQRLLSRRVGRSLEGQPTQRELPLESVMQLLARAILDSKRFDTQLFDELENAADIPSADDENDATVLCERAFAELQLARVKALRADNTIAHSELDGANHGTPSLSSSGRVDASKHEQEYQELSEENELLLLQMTQLQDELERYFRKYQELKSQADASQYIHSKSADKKDSNRSHSPPVAAAEQSVVDMRTFVDGRGWHNPETNGRWAGAAASSTITLGALAPANYRVKVRIVDAMSLDHLRGIKLSFNGVELSSKLTILSDMGGRLAPLRRAKAAYRNVANPYPATITARVSRNMFNEDEESAQFGIRSIEPVSPATHGESDVRALSVCVQSIEFEAIS